MNNTKTVIRKTFIETTFDMYRDVYHFEVEYSDGTKEMIQERVVISD